MGWSRVLVTVTVVSTMLTTACSDGAGSPEQQGHSFDLSSTTTDRSAAGLDGAPSDERPSADEGIAVIEGIVVAVAIDERTMTLERAERGFQVVELGPRAELLHADGTVADLAEHVATGSAIRATGRPGSAPEVLLASRVVILGDE